MADHHVASSDFEKVMFPKREIRAHVDSAYELLQYAAKHSAQLPNDVLVAITTAGESISKSHRLKDADEETRFWNAYSLLFSNRLADQARQRYRIMLYVVLAVLITTQIYYLAGSLVLNRLGQVETEWQGAAAALNAEAAAGDPAATEKPLPATGNSAPAGSTITTAAASNSSEDWQRLRRFGISHANYYLGRQLVPFFQEEKDLPAGISPHDMVKAKFMANYMRLKEDLELITLALSGYILPLLYGTLGAFAYVFRKLSDPIVKLNFASETWSVYTFRLHIGALGGLAVGWFSSGNEPSTGAGALSPLALAFAAGYGSDLLFTMLDKVVAAFSSASSTQTGVKTETRQEGGMTIMTETQREAKVSGVPDGVAAGQNEVGIGEVDKAPIGAAGNARAAAGGGTSLRIAE